MFSPLFGGDGTHTPYHNGWGYKSGVIHCNSMELETTPEQAPMHGNECPCPRCGRQLIEEKLPAELLEAGVPEGIGETVLICDDIECGFYEY